MIPEWVGSQHMKSTCSKNAWDFKFVKIWCSKLCMFYNICCGIWLIVPWYLVNIMYKNYNSTKRDEWRFPQHLFSWPQKFGLVVEMQVPTHWRHCWRCHPYNPVPVLKIKMQTCRFPPPALKILTLLLEDNEQIVFLCNHIWIFPSSVWRDFKYL